jgi:1-acyl-sn-glycerol-3-phosphate acyltransferase
LRHFFTQAYEFLLVALGFFYWGVVGSLITGLSLILYPLLPKKYSKPCGRFLLQKAFIIFIAYLKVTRFVVIDDRVLSRLANYQGGVIIAPNHIALWDAIFLIAYVPKIVCIMKGSILRNPILGGGARLAGYIPNDSTGQMLRTATEQLKQGETLLIFPEGTRTRKKADWVNPFQGLTALMAKQTHAPIIPVYIRSDNRFLEKGNPLFYKPKFPLHLSFEVGKAVWFSKEDTVKNFTRILEKNHIKMLSQSHPLRRDKRTRL